MLTLVGLFGSVRGGSFNSALTKRILRVPAD